MKHQGDNEGLEKEEPELCLWAGKSQFWGKFQTY